MEVHFEDLWEKCENFYKESAKDIDSQSVIDGLILKVNLYKTLDAQKEILGEEMQKVKSRTLGEILLTITYLSFKDNIDVYESLETALQYRTINFLNKKHPM